MQKAVAGRRTQDDAPGSTATISLGKARPGEAPKARAEIEVIPEVLHQFPALSGREAALCRELLAFLLEFKTAAPPKLSLVRPAGRPVRARPAVHRPLRYDELLIEFLREFEDAKPILLARSAPASRVTAAREAAIQLRGVAIPLREAA